MATLSRKELEELVHADVIDSQTAERIQHYFDSRKEGAPNKFAIVLWALGALLIGSGIVLVIAHNWDEIPKFTKAIIAFLPLVTAQTLCLYALVRPQSRVFAEISAILLFFAVATCISLVSQIYHISGTTTEFLQTWILLTIPLVYVMRSQVVALLLLVLITWHATLVGYGGRYGGADPFPWLYIGCLIILAPNYYFLLKKGKQGIALFFHHWIIALSLIITLGTLEIRSSAPYELYFGGYMALFTLFFLVGRQPYFVRQPLKLNPFLVLGVVGILSVLIGWSYDILWDDRREGFNNIFLARYSMAWITIALAALIGYLLIVQSRKKMSTHEVLIGSSVFVFCVTVLFFRDSTAIGMLIMNLWLLVIAISFIRRGAARDDLAMLNFGILIIGVLAVMRFFDESIPFLFRGLFFLVTGLGFFGANYVMLKKRKQKKPAEL